MERYLEYVSALVGDEDFVHTQQLVEDFMKKTGPELQSALEAREQESIRNGEETSYVEEFWDSMYLEDRLTLPINTNPFFLINDHPVYSKACSQINRASSLIASLVRFYHMIKCNNLAPDFERHVPLCMFQYANLFGCARIPDERRDSVSRAPDSNHIVVLCGGLFYSFQVVDDVWKLHNGRWEDAKLISERDVEKNIRYILSDVNNKMFADRQAPVGTLTCLPRVKWAQLRSSLSAHHAVNRETLKAIDDALFVVCLDDFSPASSEAVSKVMLHGDGRNRWFDKCFQLIVCSNGKSGINMEHSSLDGHTVLRFATDVFLDAMQRRKDDSSLTLGATLPQTLNWELTEEHLDEIEAAGSQIDAMIETIETQVLEFTDFGKSLIVKHSLSPDSFVQMAFQLAFYRLFDKVASTYESALTKRFMRGRTEAVRSVSRESNSFVQTFLTPGASMEAKKEALRRAVQKQVKRMEECKNGFGVDRHLFALKKLALKMGHDLPAIYDDKAYKTLTHTVLSTSNCGGKALVLFGFGPVVDNGFGIGYMIKDNSIIINLTSNHQRTEAFMNALKQSLLQMRHVIEAPSSTTPTPHVKKEVKAIASFHRKRMPSVMNLTHLPAELVRGQSEHLLEVPPTLEFSSQALVGSFEDYMDMYSKSIQDPSKFWGIIARCFQWDKLWTRVMEGSFSALPVRWFVGGATNICYNAVDRHVVSGCAGVAAIHWRGSEVDEKLTLTYEQLLDKICRAANVLKGLGVRKGSRVVLYMPMIPETVIAMLACARIGAVHVVVFSGFSTDALARRVCASKAEIIVTCTKTNRGSKIIDLYSVASTAVAQCAKEGHVVRHVLVVVKEKVALQEGRDVEWEPKLAAASPKCPVEWVDSLDPLFILYTSGSTADAKPVVHTTGGYMVYTATTFKYCFDYHVGDVFFCTADVGWITGHSYTIYAPLLNGGTTVIFSGLILHPDAGRLWQIVDDVGVTQFYTTPTAVRVLMKENQTTDWVSKYKRTSLRVLGSVGEPIDPNSWRWYHRVVGDRRCPIVDTWWQTETGGVMISPLPGAGPAKPGCAMRPFFGIVPVILNNDGVEVDGPDSGLLAIKTPWPSFLGALDEQSATNIKETYFSVPGYYVTGDAATRDLDGCYWINGRVDDVLSVSGRRLGPVEIEGAIMSHSSVLEAAVVSVPDDVKGQCILSFVVLKDVDAANEQLDAEVKSVVRSQVGAFATPEIIIFTPVLPKTRSGKIPRKLLMAVARGEQQFGDLSSLADASVIAKLCDIVALRNAKPNLAKTI